MEILVPIDGTDCSERALEFAVTFANRFDASIHVVHFSDRKTDATETILSRAGDALVAAGFDDDPELLERGSGVRDANEIGKAILELVAEHGYDHVVMGHETQGTVGRAILGSAAETVVRAEQVPVTVVPAGDDTADG
jgi:nucleotide-binding universal stress UspA family protein